MKNTFIKTGTELLIVWLALLMVMIPALGSAADGNAKISDLEFKQASIQDAFRVISELTDTNIVVTSGAGARKLTVYLRNTTVKDAIDSICRVSGLWYRFNDKTGVYLIMTTEEYQKDVVVFREDETAVFTLHFQNVASTARIIQELYDDRVVYTPAVDNDAFGLNTASNSRDRISSSSGRTLSSISRNTSSSSNRVQNIEDLNSNTLTTEQISVLDSLGVGRQVSEQLLSSITQRRQADIFLSTNLLHNQLFVRSSDKKALADIRGLVKDLDRPVPQVLLEMKILDVAIGDGFTSILDMNFTSAGTSSGPASDQPRNPLSPSATTGPNLALGLGNFALGGGTALFQLMNDHILARLQLMESQDKVEVLATPMLLASNNTPARLFIGEERILTTGLDSTVFTTEGVGTRAVITPETEQRDIGNTLLIVPSVNSDRTVTLRIQQDTSTVSPKSSRIPVPISDGTLQEVEVDTVNTANIEGTVIARDGLTVAVGGMIRTTATDNEQRVPLLGSVPVLGQLFRRDVRSFKRSEMVLLITPHVFATPEEAQATTKDRMADLLDPSSSVNVYLDSGRTEAPRPDQERPRLGRGGEKKKREVVGQYATLTRFAMLAMRQPETPFPAEIDLMPIPDPESAKALIDANSVKVEPLAAWQGHGHYVTALRLANLSASELRLQQNHLRGKWRAITFEDTTLEPAGKLGDSTMAYVVSSLPFSQALGAKP